MSKLGGLIMSSDNPKRLADFYRSHFAIPYRVNQHGNLPAHYECDEDGVHFAIIPGRTNPPGNIAPSFFVEDLDATLAEFEREGVKPLHAVMELGGGPRICTIPDPDGNPVRLWSPRQRTGDVVPGPTSRFLHDEHAHHLRMVHAMDCCRSDGVHRERSLGARSEHPG